MSFSIDLFRSPTVKFYEITQTGNAVYFKKCVYTINKNDILQAILEKALENKIAIAQEKGKLAIVNTQEYTGKQFVKLTKSNKEKDVTNTLNVQELTSQDIESIKQAINQLKAQREEAIPTLIDTPKKEKGKQTAEIKEPVSNKDEKTEDKKTSEAPTPLRAPKATTNQESDRKTKKAKEKKQEEENKKIGDNILEEDIKRSDLLKDIRQKHTN